MTTFDIKQSLPSTLELPCSDDTPVDNEDQNLLPNLLLMLLTHLWADRMDWFFAVDMAVYHTTGTSHRVPVVPDAFLSLGVSRLKNGDTRFSYATWEENDIIPILALETVSKKYGDEYEDKMAIYEKLGVLYYVVYNQKFWSRDKHKPFEVYKLVNGEYRLQIGEPYWMPEVGLGIGRYQTTFGNIPKEILTWYDEKGTRLLSAEEWQSARAEQERMRAEQEKARAEQERTRAEQEKARAEQERTRAEKVIARNKQLEQILRESGIDPNEI